MVQPKTPTDIHVTYDPYDPAVQDDPYPVYRWLRNHAPSFWNAEREFWTLSRFDDVWMAVHDHERFSSAGGIMVGQDLISDLTSSQWPTMITLDPPRHDELRRLVSRAFTPRAIAAMEDDVRAIARSLLDGLPGSEFDLVECFSGPLPVMVIAQMLGVPVSDRVAFKHWSDEMVQANPDDPATVERAVAAGAELYRYFRASIAERRDQPADDMISALIAVQDGGQHLDDRELLGICFLLLAAGNETTTNLISNATCVLADHPEERRRCASDPSRIAPMLEEVLRFESPVQGLARTLTADVELHGEVLRAGDKVLLLFAAANRDDREFDDPDRFLVGRRAERMLAFGHGIHHCLGAALARLEARVAFEELFARMPQPSVTAEGTRIRSGPVRGFTELPVSS